MFQALCFMYVTIFNPPSSHRRYIIISMVKLGNRGSEVNYLILAREWPPSRFTSRGVSFFASMARYIRDRHGNDAIKFQGTQQP